MVIRWHTAVCIGLFITSCSRAPGQATLEPTHGAVVGGLPTQVATDLTPGIAAQIVMLSWSPEGQWLAALVSTLEDVRSDFDWYSPPATLFFIEAATGRPCPLGELGRFVGHSDPVSWRSDERIVVAIRDRVYEGRPCQTEPFALVKSDSKDVRSPIASPVGGVEAETRLVSLENGIGAIETRLLADDGRVLATVAWRAAERIGGGVWRARGSTIRWVKFPDADLIGEWTMSPYEAMPGLPSPDGRAWAMVGQYSRRQEAALVIARRP